MTSVQIKNVPDETLAVLKQRAARAHQSLQEYLLAGLIAQAKRETVEEVLQRAAGRRSTSVTMADATSAVRAERDRR
jgi:plasmid stability protein